MPRRRSAPGPTSATSAEADGTSLGNVYEGFLRIARSPLPTLAAVNGAAVGAGMNLALGCDVRLAARRARFDTRFLQIGLHPGGGHTWMLRRIVGPQATMAAVVFGEVIDGAEAERVGLVYRCVDDDDLLDAAHEMAARAASAPRELVIVTKAHDPATWPTSPTTRRPWRASSSPSSGAPASRGSPSGSPRCKPGSDAGSRQSARHCLRGHLAVRGVRLPHGEELTTGYSAR